MHFRHCLGEAGTVIASYEVAASTQTGYNGVVNGSDLFSDLPLDTALWYLTQDAITRLNGAATQALVFHAAAVALSGTGIILCGQSGSGKSSLTTWLVASGFDYLTDEVIALQVEGDEIGGLGRTIVLKSGSAFIWKHWLGEARQGGFRRFKDGSAWIDPALLNPQGIRNSTRPGLLLFPRYEAAAELQIEPLTAAGSLFRLMQGLVNARNFPDHGLGAASRLARQVQAYSLIYSDLEVATRWIKANIAKG